jgi:hypothetical protein
MNIIKEGGNVFKDAQGQPVTQRINRADVPATVAWLESVLGMQFPEDRWLGSTGRAATSGDLDLAVDLQDATKDQIATALTRLVLLRGQDPRDWVRKSGEVHFKTPIAGDPSRGFVQTDFMFFPNVDWGTFFYAGGTDSAYKGMIRNVLMSSLAKHQGLKVGANGMFSRTTNQLVGNGLDPDYVAAVLLGRGRTREDLKNVETIYQALARDPDRDAKLKDFREYLAREGLTEPELAVQESDVHFLARLRDRIVNQGMVPLVEHDRSIVTEGKDPRIPYVEDLVFKAGLRGLQQALDIIKQSAEDSRKFVTIKWDGSPAIIFGRKPNGEFVLTDKAGATAVGYDGLATSPSMISDIMQRRDAGDAAKGKKSDRSSLSQMYRNIWPYFEAAVPENFRGYVKGDLLYHPQDPYQEQSGLYLFQPNKYGGIPYRIPIDSPLGQQIAGTRVGVALHTQMSDPTSPEEPITKDIDKMFVPVPGLMMSSAKVKNLQNIVPDQNIVRQLNQIARGPNGQAINQLLNPAELRAMKITDLPALMESFINSLKGTDYSQATPAEFGKWLQSNVTPNKFQNIIEYLNSPKSNITGMAAAFTAWNLLHELKIDIKRQLDLQQPGQEGWVMATPAGRAKIVDRRAGGFAGDRALATKQS